MKINSTTNIQKDAHLLNRIEGQQRTIVIKLFGDSHFRVRSFNLTLEQYNGLVEIINFYGSKACTVRHNIGLPGMLLDSIVQHKEISHLNLNIILKSLYLMKDYIHNEKVCLNISKNALQELIFLIDNTIILR